MNLFICCDQVSIHYPFRDPEQYSLRNTIARKIRRVPSVVKHVQALNNISLQIHESQRVGLIGANGSGKTTLLKTIAGILYPTQGNIHVSGHVQSIFDPTLGMDQEASGLENIKIRCMLMHIPEQKIQQKIDEVAEFSELGEALRRPIKGYSAGMSMRLAFSIATSIEPEILVIDEWLSAGDSRFVHKAFKRMHEVIQSSKILVMSSHAPDILKQWCNRLIWMENGCIVADGNTSDVLGCYMKQRA